MARVPTGGLFVFPGLCRIEPQAAAVDRDHLGRCRGRGAALKLLQGRNAPIDRREMPAKCCELLPELTSVNLLLHTLIVRFRRYESQIGRVWALGRIHSPVLLYLVLALGIARFELLAAPGAHRRHAVAGTLLAADPQHLAHYQVGCVAGRGWPEFPVEGMGARSSVFRHDSSFAEDSLLPGCSGSPSAQRRPRTGIRFP